MDALLIQPSHLVRKEGKESGMSAWEGKALVQDGNSERGGRRQIKRMRGVISKEDEMRRRKPETTLLLTHGAP